MSKKQILSLIKKSKSFLISSHVNPDPDALCSEIALALYLRSLGKTVDIINEAPVPKRYQFLPGSNSIKWLNHHKRKSFEVAFILDCGELDRIGKVKTLISKQCRVVNIDHHITNEHFGHLNWVDPKASSTAEILYELLFYGRCGFTHDIAANLYSGILTDTGSFRYANTTQKTHMIVSRLLQHKFSAYDLYRKFYETMPLKDAKYFVKVISQFEDLCSGKVLCVELRKNILDKFSDAFDLRDTIFKFLRAIKDAEVFVIFTELKTSQTRVNLRSSSRFNVATLASYFGGGGHRRASGCVINKNIQKTRKDVLKQIKKML